MGGMRILDTTCIFCVSEIMVIPRRCSTCLHLEIQYLDISLLLLVKGLLYCLDGGDELGFT